MVPVAAALAEHETDVPIDGFDRPEGDLLVAVSEDAVEMPGEELGDLLEGGQPLPAQDWQSGREESPRRPFVGEGPELGQLLF